MIDSYDFGEIVIDGRRYTSDVIIYPDRVEGEWWRREGHVLTTDDLKHVLVFKPDVIVVGTGYSGIMRVPLDTEKLIRSKGIELIIEPTTRAWQTYNQLCPGRKVIAMLHLTC